MVSRKKLINMQPESLIYSTSMLQFSQKEGGSIMTIAETIKTLRKEMKLTQDKFAGKIGIHGRQLARYEVGKSTPSIDALTKIAKFCEVTADYLIYGHDNQLADRLKVKDPELLDLLRMIDRLKKPERERLKWALHGLLNNK